MNNVKRLTLLLVILLFMSLLSCDLADGDPKKKIKIVSSGDGFYGYYYVDDGDMKEFKVSTLKSGSSFFSFSKGVESAKSVYIWATAISDSTSSITIQIFDDDEIVEKETVSKETDVTLANEVSYTFSEDDDSSSSENSSSSSNTTKRIELRK